MASSRAVVRVKVVVVRVEVIDVEAGLWCRTCALPSGLRFWAITNPAMTMHAVLRCRDCGGHDIEAPSGSQR